MLVDGAGVWSVVHRLGRRAGARVAAAALTLLVSMPLWPAAADGDGDAVPIAAPPIARPPVEPLRPKPPVAESPAAPPGDLATPAPPPIGPDQGPTAPLTFQVRANDGLWLTGVPQVPLPLDYNDDLAADGTFTVTVANAPPSACLRIDFKLPLAGGRASRLEFRHADVDLVLSFGNLPALVTACIRGDDRRPHVTLSSGGSPGSLGAFLARGDQRLAVDLDRTPAMLDLALDASQPGVVTVDHSASTSLRVAFSLASPPLRGTIDRLPTGFDGRIEFRPDAPAGVARVEYDATAGLGLVQFTWGREFDADYATATLRNLPSRLSLTPTFAPEAGNLASVQLRQTASAPYGPLSFFVRADGVPLAFSAGQVPADVWSASWTPEKSVGGAGTLRFLFDASGPAVDLRLEMGEPPGPFGGTEHYLLVNVDALPALFDASLVGVGSNPTRATLRVLASAATPTLLFHAVLGHGDLDVVGNLYRLPAQLTAEVSVDGTSAVPAAPGIDVTASAPGFTLLVDATGFDLAGRLYVLARNLPTRLAAWIGAAGPDDVGRLEFSTFGTGPLEELYVEADLPKTLRTLAAHEFQIDLQNLARLSLTLKKPEACLLRACIEFAHLQVGDFWWWNAPPTVFNLNLYLDYKVQQYESCWWGACWVDKYAFRGWGNGFAYYSGQYGLDGRPARAVGTPVF